MTLHSAQGRPPPHFSLMIPTLGRATLRRAIESVLPQMRGSDEIIVVGDTHERPAEGAWQLPETAELCRSYGARVRYYEHDAGHHCWGHCQLNVAINEARQPWLHCNDDDDVWAPGALAAMRRAIERLDEPRPLLFRFRSWFGPTFWLEPGLVRENRIGGHCLVTPNLPGRVGQWTDRYTGDFDYVRSTLNCWPNYEEDAVWDPSIVAIARPS